MLRLLRRTPLERVVQLALAATIFTALLAAGSVLEWIEAARAVRWAALAALAASAVAFAVRSGRKPLDAAAYVGVALVAVALASAVWSAAPRLTLGRALAFSLVLVAAAALGHGARGRPRSVEAVLAGVLLGAAAIAVGGLLVLAFRYDRAVQAATTVSAARYQGLGGGPNMAPMVLAIASPLAFHFARAGATLGRAAAAASLVLLLGSIAFSGSRGALAAALVGLGVYALTGARGRGRLRVAAVAAALAVATLFVSQLPSPASSNPPEPTGQDPAPADVTPAQGYLDANLQGPRLQDDIGHPGAGVADTRRRERTLLGSSGRSEAWRGTLRLAAERPIAGYGFGTEDRTFVDRYVFFHSNVPENSYLGIVLQLGVVGLLALLVLAALLLRPALLPLPPIGAAAAAAFSAALVLALFQSYLYAAGNAATTAAWVCGFCVAAAAAAAVRA